MAILVVISSILFITCYLLAGWLRFRRFERDESSRLENEIIVGDAFVGRAIVGEVMPGVVVAAVATDIADAAAMPDIDVSAKVAEPPDMAPPPPMFDMATAAAYADASQDVIVAGIEMVGRIFTVERTLAKLLIVDHDWFHAKDLLTGWLMAEPSKLLLDLHHALPEVTTPFETLIHAIEQWLPDHFDGLASVDVDTLTHLGHLDAVPDWTDGAVGPTFPYAAVFVAIWYEFGEVEKRRITIERALGNIVVTAAVVGTFITAGKFAAFALGTAVGIGPALPFLASIGGVFVGAKYGKKTAGLLRRRFFVAAQERLTQGASASQRKMQERAASCRAKLAEAKREARAEAERVARQLRAEMKAGVTKTRRRMTDEREAVCDRFPTHLDAWVDQLAHEQTTHRRTRRPALRHWLYPSRALMEYVARGRAFDRVRQTLRSTKTTYVTSSASASDGTSFRWTFITTFLQSHPARHTDLTRDVEHLYQVHVGLLNDFQALQTRVRKDLDTKRAELKNTYETAHTTLEQAFTREMEQEQLTLQALRADVDREAHALGLKLA